mmetsp:Transcript_105641/g.295842  ORF Transcript_105641/g.295842 Transcript_105641/m.295842 type:complete len:225 (+) Transcript_105641:97-771(+)
MLMSAQVLTGPSTLPEMLADDTIDDAAPLCVVAVTLHKAELLGGKAGVRLRVKYGRAGNSVMCDTHDLAPLPSEVAASEFSRRPRDTCAVVGETCLFLLHRRLEPVIRLRLVRTGGNQESLAKAEFWMPPMWAEAERLELSLMSARRKCVGKVDVSVGMWSLTKGGLRSCLRSVGAELQPASALVGSATLARGTVEDAANCARAVVARAGGAHGDSVLYGAPVV